ncbi:MAG TPA: helix-turn-helix domain-containing protein, partial [Chloroflexota bacterium]|nr:helix-turn-helix domain-containing protein [Chloroflexota bacterium]
MDRAARGSFGDLLKGFRRAAGLTQEELAERAEMSARGVQDLERGLHRFPHPDTTRRLAAALGLGQREVAELLIAAQRGGSLDSAALEPRVQPALPTPLTSFVGRQAQLTEISVLLESTRLLTLTGPAGVGKSRLALEAARHLAGKGAGTVGLVELARLTDSELVTQAVADSVGVRGQPGHSLRDTLLQSLEQQHLLLALDNCEHVLQACAELSEALLRACPELRIMATSREHLGVPGEVVLRIPSLSLPAGDDAEGLAASEAGRLFLERARAVDPAFSVNQATAAAVVHVCRRLDGLALAIELAAARVIALSV